MLIFAGISCPFLNPFLLAMLNFYHLVAPSYLVMLYMLLHLSGWQGKFQGKWLSIFWSVRYAPTDNFSLSLLTNQIHQNHKIRNIFRPVFARLVTLFPEKGSLVVKTTLTEHFFRWRSPLWKSLSAEGRLRLSKQQQLNFHQNTSLPEEGTTKSIKRVLHQNQKGENQMNAEIIAFLHRTSSIIQTKHNFEKKLVMFPAHILGFFVRRL